MAASGGLGLILEFWKRGLGLVWGGSLSTVVEALSSLFWGAVGLDGRGGAGLGLRAQAGAGELGGG